MLSMKFWFGTRYKMLRHYPSSHSTMKFARCLSSKLCTTIASMITNISISQHVLCSCTTRRSLPFNFPKACSTHTRAKMCDQSNYFSGPTLLPSFGRMSPWSACSTTSCFPSESGINLPRFRRSFTWWACSAPSPRVSCLFVPR